MKRDWELIRLILLKLETLPEQEGRLMPADIEGYDWQIVSYHINILNEAGLIEAGCHRSLGAPPLYYAKRLTWQGHELLDSIRAMSMWNRIKEKAREIGVDLTVDTLKSIANTLLKEVL